MSAPRGTLALVGSGEFLPAMAEVDRDLLACARRGRGRPRVAILPTASAQDGTGVYERWGALGRQHFEALGAEVVVAEIRAADDAHDPAQVALLRECDLYYFSGGLPDILVDVFAESPAWAAIAAAYQAGAVVAGCSAGAMALGPAAVRVRDVLAGRPATWRPALGLAPGVCAFPHFDRRHDFVDDATFAAWLAAAPPGVVVVGVDEEVALVDGPREWRVLGRDGRGVTVFDGASAATLHPVGARLRLDVP